MLHRRRQGDGLQFPALQHRRRQDGPPRLHLVQEEGRFGQGPGEAGEAGEAGGGLQGQGREGEGAGLAQARGRRQRRLSGHRVPGGRGRLRRGSRRDRRRRQGGRARRERRHRRGGRGGTVPASRAAEAPAPPWVHGGGVEVDGDAHTSVLGHAAAVRVHPAAQRERAGAGGEWQEGPREELREDQPDRREERQGPREAPERPREDRHHAGAEAVERREEAHPQRAREEPRGPKADAGREGAAREGHQVHQGVERACRDAEEGREREVED
mmetsp:Transcript_3192/g.7218  ORF Transcript_3192/g.7218 Transcript_3192/m.7218 type:complete len:270 (-) Transcript_3192:1956-2765(-)